MIKSSILYLIILSKFPQYPLSYFMRFIGQKFLLSTLFPSFLKKLFSKLKFCSIIKATILCKLLGGHPMLFIHANLVTMEPAPQGFLSIPDGFLLTEGSRIAALGPMSDCPDISAFSPEEVFDLKGNPDCGFTTEAEYLERYPGDKYVDVVGMDNYWDFRPDGGDTSLVVLKARILTQYAQKHGKLSAITETGTQTRDSLWYTQLLSILRSEGVALNYVCTWSGFSPYKGHPAAADFCRFKRDTLVLFADEIPNFYTWH